MKRVFIAEPKISDSEIVLNDPKQIHYLRNVLRLTEDQDIIIFDQQKNEYSCVLKKISSDLISIAVKSHSRAKSVKNFSLTVACAIPKKTSMDDIVDKLTQLGADRIIPLLTERVIVKFDEKKKVLKHKRWVSISISAAQQSQRPDVPVVDPVTGIREVLKSLDTFDLK
ncbi:16S rRNA (uracil(1498)-N(3))-methyltransferase, partial [bacterium]